MPVYSYDFIENNLLDKLTLRIESDLFLELLLLKIRGESIKFSSILKRKTDKREKELIADINLLEEDANLQNSNMQLLTDKREELENLREVKIRGQHVRSRLHWLSEGERPSRFFCNLENRNFVEKTVKKINNNGQILIDQKNILQHMENYYSNLFRNRDQSLDNVDMEVLLKNIKVNKVSEPSMGKDLEVWELSSV